MPFKSQAQRGFMYAKHPKLAKEFEAATPDNAKLPEHVKKMAEGGIVEEERDPSEIPEDIKEFVKKAHKEKHESRPDENWRITSPKRGEPIAPYKKDEESEEAESETIPHMAEGGEVPMDQIDENEKFMFGVPKQPPLAINQPPAPMPQKNDVITQLAALVGKKPNPQQTPIPGYDEGGDIPDQNAILQSLAPAGAGVLTPSVSAPAAPPPPPADIAPTPVATPPTPAPAASTAPPALTDQDFMNRANTMLGLDPAKQAAFMKLLGSKSQLGQIGAGIAGIGDAIASGMTLGKVNPGGMQKAEDIIEGKQKQGLEGLKTIQESQEKAFDIAQKLQAQNPNSPLSKYAQKAYAGVGKKIGLDLSHASAGLISDVTGKGVEELQQEYEAQIKQIGLGLQKSQVEATIANQQAERQQAETNARLAHPLLSALGKIPNVTGSSNAATKYAPDVIAYAQKHGITPDQAQIQKDRRRIGT